ncbi:MAG: carbohydrate kinase [Bacteroidota bacterium]
MNNPKLICFGEVLWDLLPSGKIAGGAPMNVAFHANNLGFSTQMISRVGDDVLGAELLAFLNGKGVSTQYVQIDTAHPTGTVEVTLSSTGSPSYVIIEDVAWDHISDNNEIHDMSLLESDALVFGSLACRSEQTKKTLLALLDAATLRVFDTNLRSPFYSKELLEELLSKADIAKMNDEELRILADWNGVGGSEADQMRFLKEKFGLDLLMLTKGDQGAACLDDKGYHTHPGFPVTVQDTIGSGDAFLAAFLSKMLAGASSPECLEYACALGALVATKQGGTPNVTRQEIQQFIHSKSI